MTLHIERVLDADGNYCYELQDDNGYAHSWQFETEAQAQSRLMAIELDN